VRSKLTHGRQEGQSGEITLKDDDPEMVERMISFFYNLTYSCGNATDNVNNSNDSTVVTSHEDIITHASMFGLAVKYQVKELQHFAKCSFRHAAQTAWDSGAFLEAIDIAFTSTPEDVSDLRDIALDTIYDHFQTMMDKPEIEELCASHPKLTYGLLKRNTDYSQRYLEATESECAVCHKTKRDARFSPGLPKICVQCNGGQAEWD
jgi:hypothetical protein